METRWFVDAGIQIGVIAFTSAARGYFNELPVEACAKFR